MIKKYSISIFILFSSFLLFSCSDKPSHKFVDIGGYNIEANILGNGKPAIIFENALGGNATFWDSIQIRLSKYSKVMTYNRPGNGESDISPLPRTSTNMAE